MQRYVFSISCSLCKIVRNRSRKSFRVSPTTDQREWWKLRLPAARRTQCVKKAGISLLTHASKVKKQLVIKTWNSKKNQWFHGFIIRREKP